MTLRGAYVELNFVHGEIQPTFAWIANKLGIELDFYLLRENANLRPLATVAGHPKITEIVVPNPHEPCRTPLPDRGFADLSRYQFLILGTAEPPDRATALADITLPQLHVVHNPLTWTNKNPNVTPCALATRVVKTLPPHAIVVEPYHLGDASRFEPPSGRASYRSRTTVCVPGNVQVGRRNLGSLVRGLARLRAEGVGVEDIHVHLVGRAFDVPRFGGRMDLDGSQLQRALTDAKVLEFTTITPRELTFPELYGAVAAADFVLPLIDDCYVHTRRYIETKASGAFNVGLGAGLVPILNDTFASAVGIRVGPRYRLDDAGSGLAAALSTDAPDLARHAVKQWRDRRLENAALSFGTWLERVT